MAGDFSKRAGELDAGGAAADHHEREPRGALRGVGLALGALESDEDARANAERVVQGLQPRRERRPGVVAEVVVDRACGEHQVVVGKLGAILEAQAAARGVDGLHLAEQHRGVRLPREDVADRPGDGGRRQARGGDLVEERREQVVVGAVYDRELDRRAAQRPRRPQPAEAASYDHDARSRHARDDTSCYAIYRRGVAQSPGAALNDAHQLFWEPT
jgi:hypothetical protein